MGLPDNGSTSDDTFLIFAPFFSSGLFFWGIFLATSGYSYGGSRMGCVRATQNSTTRWTYGKGFLPFLLPLLILSSLLSFFTTYDLNELSRKQSTSGLGQVGPTSKLGDEQ